MHWCCGTTLPLASAGVLPHASRPPACFALLLRSCRQAATACFAACLFSTVSCNECAYCKIAGSRAGCKRFGFRFTPSAVALLLQAGTSSKHDREFLRALAARQRQDYSDYLKHIRASFAKHGNKQAALELGQIYWEGKGGRQSCEQALEYYYQALQTTPG